jgi:oligopeptide transport system permease protein
MLGFTARRLALLLPVVFGASLIVFLSVFALPGDPVSLLGGQRQVSPEARSAIEQKYHLDEPIWSQYGHWISGVVVGDLGESFATRRPVRDMIGEALPNTLRLAGLAVLIEAVVGMSAGVLAAITGRRFVDMLVVVSTTLLVAIPVYVLGTSLQYMFGLRWELLPVSGVDDGFRSWVLPAMVLALPSLAYVTRLTRTSLADTQHAGYVEMAVAKGLSPTRVTVNHRLRNALIPVVTFLAIEFGALLAGALFVETVFNINGMAQMTVKSITQRDSNVVVGCTLVFVVGFLLANLAADQTVGALDPRVRDE